jgi:hypothetical protein
MASYRHSTGDRRGRLVGSAPHLVSSYKELAGASGDDVTALTLDGSGHFDMLHPGTRYYEEVQGCACQHLITCVGLWLWSSSCGNGADHIVRRQGPPDPLQFELTHGLDLHGVLDFHQHSRADEDLTRLGFVAKPRGKTMRPCAAASG